MKNDIQRTESVHKPDTVARDQFVWLRQVAADGDLPPTASRIAIVLTSYFNREYDGAAWMSQATLANDLGVTERTVRAGLAGLVDLGHLTSVRRGMTETNLYYLAIKDRGDRQSVADHVQQDIAGHDRQYRAAHNGVTGRSVQSDRKKHVRVTGNVFPTNPLKEPIEEPIEESLSLPLDIGGDSGRRSSSPSADIVAHFEVWWVQYPLKKAKVAACKAYGAVISKKLASPEELLAGALRYAAERSGQDPHYTKHPATWLNKGCWADEQPKTIGSGLPAKYPVRSGYDHLDIGAAMARQMMHEEARRGR